MSRVCLEVGIDRFSRGFFLRGGVIKEVDDLGYVLDNGNNVNIEYSENFGWAAIRTRVVLRSLRNLMKNKVKTRPEHHKSLADLELEANVNARRELAKRLGREDNYSWSVIYLEISSLLRIKEKIAPIFEKYTHSFLDSMEPDDPNFDRKIHITGEISLKDIRSILFDLGIEANDET